MLPHPIPSEGRTWFVPGKCGFCVHRNRPISGTASFLHSVSAWAALQPLRRESSEPPHHAVRVSNCRASRCTQEGAGAEGRRFPRSTLPPLQPKLARHPRIQRGASSSPPHHEMTPNNTKHFTWSMALDKITHHDVAIAIEKPSSTDVSRAA